MTVRAFLRYPGVGCNATVKRRTFSWIGRVRASSRAKTDTHGRQATRSAVCACVHVRVFRHREARHAQSRICQPKEGWRGRPTSLCTVCHGFIEPHERQRKLFNALTHTGTTCVSPLDPPAGTVNTTSDRTINHLTHRNGLRLSHRPNSSRNYLKHLRKTFHSGKTHVVVPSTLRAHRYSVQTRRRLLASACKYCST